MIEFDNLLPKEDDSPAPILPPPSKAAAPPRPKTPRPRVKPQLRDLIGAELHARPLPDDPRKWRRAALQWLTSPNLTLAHGEPMAPTVIPRQCQCQTIPVCALSPGADPVSVWYRAEKLTTPGGAATFSGLSACGSSVCVHCGAMKATENTARLGAALRSYQRQGRAILVGLVTVPHTKQDKLEHLWDVLKESWTEINKRWTGKLPKGVKKIAHVLSSEDTWSLKSGHHPHGHFVLALSRNITETEEREIKSKIFADWSSAVFSRLGRRCDPRGFGLDRMRSWADTAQYLLKIAQEVSGGCNKLGHKQGHYTPNQLLNMAATKGAVWALEAYNQFQAAAYHRQMMSGLGNFFSKSGATEQDILDVRKQLFGEETDKHFVCHLLREAFKGLVKLSAQNWILEIVESGYALALQAASLALEHDDMISMFKTSSDEEIATFLLVELARRGAPMHDLPPAARLALSSPPTRGAHYQIPIQDLI